MPYLLELGLTKSKTSLVWVAGPLSGLIVAPIIGAVADSSKSQWGRRRPFMLGGSFVVAAFFFTLGWATEIVHSIVGDSTADNFYAICLAVVSIYAIDFAINVVQWSCRGLVIDTLPTAKQQHGSAWSGRMTAIGHLIGYLIGSLNLKTILGTSLGSTQFKQLTVISAFALIGAVSLTCWAVTEKVLISDGFGLGSVSKRFGALCNETPIFEFTTPTVLLMRPPGWFPFLFYSSTWVGETYFKYDAPHLAANTTDRSGDIGRIGSMALITFSLVTFAGSIVLPWLVKSPEDESRRYTLRPPVSLAPIAEEVTRRKPDLLTAYKYSHLIFASAMLMAPFVGSVRFATILVAICGVPWALAQWAPLAFMGVEINKISQGNSMGRRSHRRDSFDVNELDQDDAATGGALAGIYLGILNIFTTLPQFVGTFISMFVFSVFERPRHLGSREHSKASDVGDDSTEPMAIANVSSAPTPQNTPASNAPINSRAQQPGLSSLKEEDADRAVAAGLLANDPKIRQMIQGKLDTLVGQSSGYIEGLAPNVRRRVAGLKGVQKEHAKLESAFQEEVLQLEKKYFAKFTPLYQKRAGIVNGKSEPTEEEIKAGEKDSEDEDGKVTIKTTADDGEDDKPETGIPEFWLSAMKNEPTLASMITDEDEEALKSLTDLRMEYLDEPGFKLLFEFASNDFFSNKMLTKAYYYQEETGYGGDFIYDHADGDKVEWKSESKNLTVKVEQKKQRNKSNYDTKQTRTIKKTVPCDSFFNFFSPPKPPGDDDEDAAEDLEERLELDYTLGEDIKEKLIPRAIDWFTGEALQFESLGDDDMEDGEFEDEDDEDEDDLSDDHDDDDESEEEVDGPRSQKQDAAECKQS
ncbi:MAG: hypothetical protein M1828_005233 [Chrysothrix sp. TS-e1954]|nr:MAG: hypothetical protein M1828_005233 [Chrysothrix sp. TS-e1954]